MTKRELKLNSLSRYSKKSQQFVLEEHGNCEVPAGCGGVVLRWMNPHRAIPLQVWLQTNGKTSFYLDGKPIVSGRPVVEYGKHVFGFRISHPDSTSGVLMFAGIYDQAETRDVTVSRKISYKVQILSAADGSWRYATNEPKDDSWLTLDFDDSNWRSMIQRDYRKPQKLGPDQYRFDKLTAFGARGLGISEKAECLWIRKVFSLSRPDHTQI